MMTITIMTNFAVRLITREYREKHDVWVSSDVCHVVVEAENKNKARSKIKDKFPFPEYVVGRVSKTSKEPGVYDIEIRGL